MILTGGQWSMKKVQQYNLAGSMGTDLPDLNTGRFRHSCGSYLHSGEVVSTNTIDMRITKFTLSISIVKSINQFQYLC